MRWLIFPLLLLSLQVHPLLSQTAADNGKSSPEEEAFQIYSEHTTQEFDAFSHAEQLAFERLREKIVQEWGDYLLSTRSQWVEYHWDLRTRTRVDFEKGLATVEFLVEIKETAPGNQQLAMRVLPSFDADEQEVDPEIKLKLEEAVVRLLMDPGTSPGFGTIGADDTAQVPKPRSATPLLAGQVARRDGTPVTPYNVADFASETLLTGQVRTQKVEGLDGLERETATLSFPLVPDHLRRRALSFASLVKEYADRFELEAALVFALIHTESHFNPQARSPTPAYGLMQLVPSSGGRVAYGYVYQKERILPSDYFFVPKQNIELGCAYLKYLRQEMFGKVEDERRALYCIIASYNTGPGNVSRAFTGDQALWKAIPLIRKMSPEELYEHLRQKLPYKETRTYIQKVTERMALYEDWR